MKAIFFALFSIISVLSVGAQPSGTYIGDWQNTCVAQCAPQSFVITPVNSSSATIVFTFTADNLVICQQSLSSLDLTLGSTTGTLTSTLSGIWHDNFGFSLVDTNNTLSYQFGNATTFLYNTNGAIFSQQDSLGAIGGSWISPVPAGNTVASACCAPDSIFLEVVTPQAELSALFTYSTSPSCAGVNTTTYKYAILTPGTTAITWNGAPNTQGLAKNNITFIPNANLTNYTMTFSSTCSFVFQKAPIPQPLNFTWTRDWQSGPALNTSIPNTYQIASITYGDIANSFMTSTITDQNGVVTNSYVVETPQGTYYDTAGMTYTYDPNTNTLMDASDAQLLSANGSLLSSSVFIGSWTNPVELYNNSLPIGCCVPTSVNIYNNGTGQTPLQVTYQLPSNYGNIENCMGLTGVVDAANAQVYSTLNVLTPSLTSITWVDTLTAKLSRVNPTQLAIQDFLGCNMSLSLYVAPPVPPGPLSASLVSTGIVSLVAGLFMIFAF
jgi:hypothetical protein